MGGGERDTHRHPTPTAQKHGLKLLAHYGFQRKSEAMRSVTAGSNKINLIIMALGLRCLGTYNAPIPLGNQA